MMVTAAKMIQTSSEARSFLTENKETIRHGGEMGQRDSGEECSVNKYGR